MEILYCGIITEKERFKALLEEIGSMPFAQSKLEHMILEGFEKNEFHDTITILSTLPVPRYPRYKKLWVNLKPGTLYGHDLRYNSFVNLPVIKQLSTFFSNVWSMNRWARGRRKGEGGVILIYGTNPLNSIPAFLTRWIHGTPVVTYVTEIDSLRLFDAESLASRIKNRTYISLSKFVERSFDGYLLLSDHMREKIETGDRPVEILEGMVRENIATEEADGQEAAEMKRSSEEIIYAGTLNRRYGIENLVRAFLSLEDEKHKLIIYGRGDYEKELESICKAHDNVVYLGAKPNEEVVRAEKKAKLLVNPRPSDETFTRFSFPSKILEYMTTGTPCLITRLEGIPDEYYNYCYAFQEESVEGMAQMLKKVLEVDNDKLKKKGLEAKKFVIQEKNNIRQTQKISLFLQKHFS